MKFTTKIAAFLVCGLVCGLVNGQESTINVLAVELPPGGGAYTAQITTQMANLASHWPNPNGITVTLINGGAPTFLNAGIGGGNIAVQLQNATAELVAQNRRGTADIVIFFSPFVTGACGYAPMPNWNSDGRHQFIANSNGLDLDGADYYYAAIMSLGSCATTIPEAALHEFGHLFSAGHSFTGPNASPQGYYLLPGNHAWWLSVPYYPQFSQKTIMAQGGIGGFQNWQFSHFPELGTNNSAGLLVTARSLANYRTGLADPGTPTLAQCGDGIDNDGNSLTDYPNDAGCSSSTDSQEYSVPPSPGCGLTSPIVVTGVLTGVCVPSYPYTSHRISWIDVCPTASSNYQVWYNQFGSYVYGWSTLAPVEDILVWGANASIKIKACSGAVCSSLSASSYLAVSGC